MVQECSKSDTIPAAGEAALAGLLQGFEIDMPPADKLSALVRHGADQLALPGSGGTLERWRALAQVAASDLGLAKLYEGHTDALATMAELHVHPPAPEGSRWAVWCAEPPGERVLAAITDLSGAAKASSGAKVVLSGRKPWCSGAQAVDHGLVGGWLEDGQRCLIAVSMHQPGIATDGSTWQAVGMASSASVDVCFDGATGMLVGEPGQYLGRPGFAHGGAGVAACWYGAAARIGLYLHAAAAQGKDPYRQAHLGAIDVALSSAASLLREAAAQIDRTPTLPCLLAVQRARLAVEAAVEEVLRRVPRAIGAGPLCKDRHLALLMADLPVFVRQSHAECDQAALGAHLVDMREECPWML